MRTEKRALELAAEALPCPFCGERLVVANDHHGYWLQHAGHLSSVCFDSVAQVLNDDDLARWNRRTPVK